ncbi:MAG TPA: ABC transporter permease, partial [Allosphingosinicella sp.]|nr:ABC transporter permease [Allosphingosinicella sp.]
MGLHYLKMCFRSMRRERFLSAINLLGLAAGLASVILIFLHVTSEYSFDRWIPGHERLYRIDTVETVPGQEPVEIANAPGPLRDSLIKDFPGIEDIARAYSAPLTVERDGRPFAEEILVADPNFFTLLALPFQSGDGARALRSPASVALSARAAVKYFGNSDPVGRRLVILTPERRDFVVSSVFETIPSHSHMKFDIVIPHEGYFPLAGEETRSIPESWAGAYFHTYARLKAGADVAAIERGLPAFVDRSLPQWLTGMLKTAPHDFFQFRFIPLRDVHFDGAPVGAMKPPASRTTVLALSLVALLILLIAAINFANLSAARSTLRSKEVALRKVVGARGRQIFLQFLVEAVTLTAIAALLGVALAEIALPWLGGLLGLERGAAWPSGWTLWAMLGGAIVVTALGSGLYPSLLAARIRPASIFGRAASGTAGGGFRGALVVGQFAISIALIATTLVIVMQTRFAGGIDLGFDRRNMLVVRAPAGPEGAALAAAFRDEAERHPDVVSAALSSAVPSDPSEDNISISLPGSVKPVQLGYHKVDPNFFRTYGVRPLAGRTASLRRADGGGSGESGSAVVNRAALGLLGFRDPERALGEVVRSGDKAFTIVGVVPDLHFRSLHQPVRQEIYVLDHRPGTAVSIRYRTSDVAAFTAAIDSLWQRRVPGHAVQREFLDDSLEALYERERSQAALLSLFSG